MRLSTANRSRITRAIFALMMTVAWSTRPYFAHADLPPAGSSLDAQTLPQIADTLDQTLRLYTAIDKSLSRATFDPSVIVTQVGQDPAKLFAWARANIAYIPYRGALRNAPGVLMDRSGNSLDQSLLLARLFQISGLTVRLAHAQLSGDQAEHLLQKHWDISPTPSSLDSATSSDDAQITAIASQSNVDPALIRSELDKGRLQSERHFEEFVATAVDQMNRLTALIKPPANASLRDRQKSSASDHWWLQCQTDQTWTDYDLLTDDANPGSHLLDPTETFPLQPDATKLPLDDSNCQTIEIRVVTEQFKSGAATRQIPLRYTLRPADLDGMPVTLVVMPPVPPTDLDPSLSLDSAKSSLRDQWLKCSTWVPALRIGSDVVMQSGFDDQGNLIANPLNNAAGKAVAGSAGAAASLFDTQTPAPAPQPQAKLTAAWIEFQFNIPGYQPVTQTRTLFDLFGPAARASGTLSDPPIDDTARARRAFGLFTSIDLLPTTSIYSSEFVIHAAIAHIMEVVPPLVKALRSSGQTPTPDLYHAIFATSTFPQSLFTLASQRNAMNPAIVLDRINLFALHHLIVPTQKGNVIPQTAIDIIANPVTQRPGAQDDPFTASFKQGIIETQLESLALSSSKIPRNTSTLVAASQPQHIDWILLHSADDLARLKLGPNSTARIASDLKAGYLIVAPVRPVPLRGLLLTGWWRIDPNDGNCIGFMSSGMGTAAVEEAETNVLAWKAAGFALDGAKALVECSGFAHLGCLVCHVAIAAALFFTPGHGGAAELAAEMTFAHGAGMACPEGGGEGGEGGGEGGGGEGGGQNYTPAGGQSTDPGMSSESGGGGGE